MWLGFGLVFAISGAAEPIRRRSYPIHISQRRAKCLNAFVGKQIEGEALADKKRLAKSPRKAKHTNAQVGTTRAAFELIAGFVVQTPRKRRFVFPCCHPIKCRHECHRTIDNIIL